MTATIKVGVKRTHNQSENANPNNNSNQNGSHEDVSAENQSKRQKIEENP